MCSRKVTNPVLFSFLKSKRGLSQSSQPPPAAPNADCARGRPSWPGWRAMAACGPSMAAGSPACLCPTAPGWAWVPPQPPAAARLSLQGGCRLVFPPKPWASPGHLVWVGRWAGWVGCWGIRWALRPWDGRCPPSPAPFICRSTWEPVREGWEQGLHLLSPDRPRVWPPCPCPA